MNMDLPGTLSETLTLLQAGVTAARAKADSVGVNLLERRKRKRKARPTRHQLQKKARSSEAEEEAARQERVFRAASQRLAARKREEGLYVPSLIRTPAFTRAERQKQLLWFPTDQDLVSSSSDQSRQTHGLLDPLCRFPEKAQPLCLRPTLRGVCSFLTLVDHLKLLEVSTEVRRVAAQVSAWSTYFCNGSERRQALLRELNSVSAALEVVTVFGPLLLPDNEVRLALSRCKRLFLSSTLFDCNLYLLLHAAASLETLTLFGAFTRQTLENFPWHRFASLKRLELVLGLMSTPRSVLLQLAQSRQLETLHVSLDSLVDLNSTLFPRLSDLRLHSLRKAPLELPHLKALTSLKHLTLLATPECESLEHPTLVSLRSNRWNGRRSRARSSESTSHSRLPSLETLVLCNYEGSDLTGLPYAPSLKALALLTPETLTSFHGLRQQCPQLETLVVQGGNYTVQSEEPEFQNLKHLRLLRSSWCYKHPLQAAVPHLRRTLRQLESPLCDHRNLCGSGNHTTCAPRAFTPTLHWLREASWSYL